MKDRIIQNWDGYEVGSPFLIYATPPCQGMSFNSVGKRLQEIRRGRAPKDDPRNQLIIPTIEIVKKLRPQWLLLENVQGMQNTIIPVGNGEYKNIPVSQNLATSDDTLQELAKVTFVDGPGLDLKRYSSVA